MARPSHASSSPPRWSLCCSARRNRWSAVSATLSDDDGEGNAPSPVGPTGGDLPRLQLTVNVNDWYTGLPLSAVIVKG